VSQLEPWSGLGGFLIVVSSVALPLVALLVWLELTRITRALWAIVSQFQAARREHPDAAASRGSTDAKGDFPPSHHVVNSMFGR
jgi:hypothetical protein